MCDRHGDYRVPDLSRLKTSRRRFLGGTAAALTLAAGPGLVGRAAAASGIRATHGTGFCNLNF
ncbi:MAG: sulfur Metabolism, partial [Methylobacterium brachiatum]|nr:sulfur Metabolism [Methylobacterium brachiatum]